MKLAISSLALAGTLGQSIPPSQEAPPSYTVIAGELNGTSVLSITAREAPVDQIIHAVAAELGTVADGFDRIATIESVSVQLKERPSDLAIRWVLGAAGLRAVLSPTGIHVIDDLSPFPDQAEVLDAAELAYLRALSRHPRDEAAPAAWMAQAAIQESRGNRTAAINDYSNVIDQHRDSELLAEALYRSGRHWAALESWPEAAANFDELASLDRAHPYHIEARIELANALCHLGDPQKALFTLDALEDYIRDAVGQHSPEDSDQRKAFRLVARARALTLLGEPLEALRSLDLATSYDPEGRHALAILEMRALALATAERYGDAAIAWMALSERTEGEARRRALAEAARNGLENDDQLGVIFIHGYAQAHGAGDATARWNALARQALGLEIVDGSVDPSELLLTAEELLESGRTAEAAREFARVYEHRDRLPADELPRLASGYARSLAADGLLDYAVVTLREIALSLPDPDVRQELYVLAAELYEQADRFEDAIAALRGEL